MSDLAVHNGSTDVAEPDDGPKDAITAVMFAGKVLAELAKLGPTDRLTVYRIIRDALTDHWSSRSVPGNLRAYRIARTVLENTKQVALADTALAAIGRLLPAADQVGAKGQVWAALDVQGQMLELAAEVTKRGAAPANSARRKPRAKAKAATKATQVTQAELDASTEALGQAINESRAARGADAGQEGPSQDSGTHHAD